LSCLAISCLAILKVRHFQRPLAPILVVLIGAGVRQPEIRWSKVDGALPVDHVTHDGTLIINQVSAQDAGVYECVAIGAYRTTRSRMELFILGAFTFSPVFHKTQIPLGSSRHISKRSTCRASRDERVERVEPCCSNMADDEKL